ncbi:MAG: DUF1330 domain-containing protein [Nitrospirota bacterium]|nr:DUF1330 domain-containing protein [Nitrospirota bacterium]
MTERYLEPTQESGAELFSRNISGEVVMLNLLRFRDVADYSGTPELAQTENISGREAYQKYIEHTLPFLKKSGGELVLLGEGGKYLIGPQDEHWDVVMLVRQRSLEAFMEFASIEGYLTGIGHRMAALEDSRLLPLVEYKDNNITKAYI